MKKLLILTLISMLILTACADKDILNETNNASNNASTNVPDEFEGLVITSKYPMKSRDYVKSGKESPKLDTVLKIITGVASEEAKSALAFESQVTMNIDTLDFNGNEYRYEWAANFIGFIEDKAKFQPVYEKLTGEKYTDRFSENFFDDTVIFIVDYHGGKLEEPFVSFDYSFNPEQKELKVSFKRRPHEGWEKNVDDFIGWFTYLIPITKSDITIDGKLVPYEELRIEVTGNLTVE